MNEKWANKANENLYSYYMEHPLEFREKHVAIQTILVDYAEENKLPLHPDWFDYPENIIKYTNIEQNLNTKNKRERSEEAYHNAAFGAWHEYDDRQKEYVLNYAKENGYFIPSNWIK